MVGGSDPSEGRVELFYEGEWGRALRYPFQPEDFLPSPFAWAAVAHVACQQVGYPYSEGLQSFGQGSGPVWLNIAVCIGDEERVEECLHYAWRSILSSYPDLGVRCRGKYKKDTHAHCDKVP